MSRDLQDKRRRRTGAAEALLVDLDGVLRQWPTVETGLPAGAVELVAFDPTLADLVLTGAL